MGPNMTNRLVVPCPGNHLLLTLLFLYHSNTDHVPMNPYSSLYPFLSCCCCCIVVFTSTVNIQSHVGTVS